MPVQAGGRTPLHGAANAGSAELATLLLVAGAAPGPANDDSVSAVRLVEQGGHAEVVALLRGASSPPRR